MKNEKKLDNDITLKEILTTYPDENTMSEKQINILVAAIEIFSEKGFKATTTSEISKRAGVGEGTIFHYYKTKKDLLLAVPDCMASIVFSKIFMEELDEILKKDFDTYEDLLRAIIKNRIKIASENLSAIQIIVKTLFQEMPFHPELRDKMAEKAGKAILGKLFGIVEKYKQKGQLVEMPNHLIIYNVATTLLGYFVSKFIFKLTVYQNADDEIEYLVNYIMHGISNIQNEKGKN